MPLQPEDRPAGSKQVLRFNGIASPDVPVDFFPKKNGSIATGGAVTDPRGLRLMFADALNLDNTEKRLDAYVYDDRQPAAQSPHDPVPTVAQPLIVNAGEEDVGLRTWAQNMYVWVKALSDNISEVLTQDCIVVLDTLTSGLGTNTGLPVLIIPIVMSGQELEDIEVDILVDIRHTTHR
jgi:hypothetical protein